MPHLLRLRHALPVHIPLAAAALLLAAAAPGARGVQPVARLSGDARLTATSGRGAVASPAVFHVHVAFSTDTPGAEPFTVQRAVVSFPDHAGTNGALFPSCGARQIARFHGNVGRCPKGSKIGGGTVVARALQIGVTATARVTIFNSAHGRAVTFNVRTDTPAYVNQSIDAPLEQLHGGVYGEQLTLVVPHSLQEILSGVYVAVRDFDVTLTGAVRRHGATYGYLKARTCPRRALHAVFGFEDWTTGQQATATADAKVRCQAR